MFCSIALQEMLLWVPNYHNDVQVHGISSPVSWVRRSIDKFNIFTEQIFYSLLCSPEQSTGRSNGVWRYINNKYNVNLIKS